ncbi:RidA family protein [Salmonella enterica]|nr:RidA family protein [Salmonella enterica]
MDNEDSFILSRLARITPPNPVGSYERGVIHKSIGFISGQLPLRDGKMEYVGRIGLELSREQGIAAAVIAAKNVLAQINKLLGDSSFFDRLLKVDGYVASANDFFDQAEILDAASEYFVNNLGERGMHARSAIGVPCLPLNAPIELVVTFSMKEQLIK